MKRITAAAERLYRRSAYALYYRWRNRDSDLPIILGNSFPKSGTHLLIRALQALEGIGPFFHRENFVRTFDDQQPFNVIRSPQRILDDIRALVPGEIAGGHIYATEMNAAVLDTPRFIHYFIYRDPRDVVVSHAFYVTEISQDHRLHGYYTQILHDLEARIRTSIVGVPDSALRFANIRARFQPYLGWLDRKSVMPIRYEDALSDPRKMLGRILDHLEAREATLSVSRDQAIDVLEAAIDPTHSPTFREGKTGSWKRYFTEEHKDLFKQTTGDLLIRLGYETGQDW